MSQNDSRWIEIFRAGDYTAQSKGKITREDLDRVVRNYDPSFHEAPVCIGHPENDKPAFGWVSKLAVDGDVLLAQEKQVEPSFDEARKAGRFKKRSASFYLGQDGKISGLRHVAWLGAQPPEVKGLGDVAFKDEGRNFVEFDEEERMDVNEKTLSEAVASYFAKILGRAPETKNFSEADARALVDQAVASATEPLNRQITELKTELNAQTTKFSEREQQLAGGEVQQRIANTINGLKSSGKWIPAFDKAGLQVVFSELARSTQTVEFGEGNQKKQVTPFDLFASFLEGLPKIVPSGRQVEQVAGGARKAVNYSEGAHTRVDQNSIALTEAANKLAKEKNISFSEALDQVVLENPELAKPAAAVAGAV